MRLRQRLSDAETRSYPGSSLRARRAAVCRIEVWLATFVSRPRDLGWSRLDDVGRSSPQGGLDLERSQLGMLGLDQRGQAGDMGGGIAVPGADRLTMILPQDRDIDAPSEELGRRIRIEVVAPAVGRMVTGHAEHRGIERRVADPLHVVRSGHDYRSPEVRPIADFMEVHGRVTFARPQGQIDDVEFLIDGPLETGKKRRNLSRQTRTQHLDAGDRCRRGERVDDARACGAVTEDVAMSTRRHLHPSLGVDREFNATLRVDDTVECRVVGVDPTVDHRHSYARALSTAEDPFFAEIGKGDGLARQFEQS